MSESFEIKTVAQLRIFNSVETRSVFESMLGEHQGISARDLCDRVQMSAETIHYHLGKLKKLGLVEDRGSRETGARPERLFGLRYTSVVLKQGKRTKAYREEVARGVRGLLRKSEREYTRACSVDCDEVFRPRSVRAVAALAPSDVLELRALEARMNQIFKDAEKAERTGCTEGRKRIALTITMAPTELTYS
jgi:DNA-binding transcriptional ArsR family regulator